MLSPVEEGGAVVAWAADITLRVKKHLYMDVHAEWPDEEGCPDRQSATWHFHVKTRRA